ncbi:hypothetical protein ACCS54_19275 [Rhizobium johnstonii]|jgi:hypothetical protein|uniref:hypothetical protein n=1 Tax=Rhizobium TaxID=379 RepID=UPI00140F4F03|nr:hypothetical protein [Rhizobium leguminosarum]QIO64039.1 hypothetical protein HA462_02795 [Rhizobium leguminosarum bv. trifolii]
MVVATKDAIIPPQMEMDQVKAANAKSVEVPSSHVGMLAYPQEVSNLIIEAAEEPPSTGRPAPIQEEVSCRRLR